MGCFEEIPRVAKAINWRLKSDIKSIAREKKSTRFIFQEHTKKLVLELKEILENETDSYRSLGESKQTEPTRCMQGQFISLNTTSPWMFRSQVSPVDHPGRLTYQQPMYVRKHSVNSFTWSKVFPNMLASFT